VRRGGKKKTNGGGGGGVGRCGGSVKPRYGEKIKGEPKKTCTLKKDVREKGKSGGPEKKATAAANPVRGVKGKHTQQRKER